MRSLVKATSRSSSSERRSTSGRTSRRMAVRRASARGDLTPCAGADGGLVAEAFGGDAGGVEPRDLRRHLASSELVGKRVGERVEEPQRRLAVAPLTELPVAVGGEHGALPERVVAVRARGEERGDVFVGRDERTQTG